MRDILNTIKKSKKIALFSHSSPDPDTIGSTVALAKILEQKGKEVSLFCDMENMSNYGFLAGYEKYNTETEFDKFDLFIAVDVASSTMLGEYEEIFM